MKLSFTLPAISVLLLSGCVNSPGYHSQPRYNIGHPNPPIANACYDCGTVIRIEHAPNQQNNPTGAVLGGVVGAVVGKEVGRSFSGSRGKRNVATVAGAVGGAIAGNVIQNQIQGQQSGYVVHVRMQDGRTTSVHLTDIGGLQQGSPVRVRDGQIYLD